MWVHMAVTRRRPNLGEVWEKEGNGARGAEAGGVVLLPLQSFAVEESRQAAKPGTGSPAGACSTGCP